MHTFLSPPAHQPLVLYVEDHPVNALLMSALFEWRPQYRLVVATSGREALNSVEDGEPALLLLDLRLPDCHGSHLLQLLRAVRGLEDVPAIAVTADGEYDYASAGFDQLWPKPLDLMGVLQSLDVLLKPLVQAPGFTPLAQRAQRTATASSWR